MAVQIWRAGRGRCAAGLTRGSTHTPRLQEARAGPGALAPPDVLPSVSLEVCLRGSMVSWARGRDERVACKRESSVADLSIHPP